MAYANNDSPTADPVPPDPAAAAAPGTERKVVYVRRDLPAEELAAEFIASRRDCDVDHYRQAVCLSEMEERGVCQLLGYSSVQHFASKKSDMSRRQARDLIAVGKALGELPQIDEAFCEGRISWTKARILCRIAVPETEKAWLATALDLSCDALERRTAGSEKGRPPREDGKGLPIPKFTVKVKLDALHYEVLEQARKKVQALAGEPETILSDALGPADPPFGDRAHVSLRTVHSPLP